MPAFYQYTPCDPLTGSVFTSNVNTITPLTGGNITFPNLLIDGKSIAGICYHIALVNSLDPGFVPDITIDWSTEDYSLYPTCEDCLEAQTPVEQCLCSTVTNTNVSTGSYRYIDCEGVNLVVNLEAGETSDKLCVREWLPNTNAQYQFYGDCVNGECPSFYLLTDCSDETNTFCSNSTSLDQYADNGTAVTLFGGAYAGKCWTITTTEECENPVVVTVNQSFPAGCIPCLNQFAINYELTNCENDSVIYTSTDLSEYTEQVVQLEAYGNDCWFVRVLNTNIPSDTPVEVTESFADCPECTSTYYLLEDCNPLSGVEPIVTITDLSVYVGQVITLSTCPEICWTVSETNYSSEYQIVSVDNDYETCEDCAATQPCYCISFYNTDSFPLSVDLIDCFGVYNKINLLPGERLEKQCLVFWLALEQIEVTNSGLCIDGSCPPERPQPKRKVTPGYNTPVCSTEYYEKVVCNFSEWMYKDVLQKRYGISNCCDEDLLKWHIKYEMLMLDILVNPDYTCTPANNCNCPVIGGVTLNTICPEVTKYIIERCDQPGVTEVVQIENTYDVLGNVIIIDDICYTVVEPTNRLVTVYWTPGTIYITCEEACPSPVTCHNYIITILTVTGTSFIYNNCQGQQQIYLVEADKTPVQITVCGVAGQVINTPEEVLEFSYVETTEICTD
jgi:hypothetical protein